MNIRGVKDGMQVVLPSGYSMKVGTEPVAVPKEFESEIRAALQHVFGIEETDEPVPTPAPPEKPEEE